MTDKRGGCGRGPQVVDTNDGNEGHRRQDPCLKSVHKRTWHESAPTPWDNDSSSDAISSHPRVRESFGPLYIHSTHAGVTDGMPWPVIQMSVDHLKDLQPSRRRFVTT